MQNISEKEKLKDELEKIKYYAKFSNIKGDPSPDIYAFDVAPVVMRWLSDANYQLWCYVKAAEENKNVSESEELLHEITHELNIISDFSDTAGADEYIQDASADEIFERAVQDVEQTAIIAKRARWLTLAENLNHIEKRLKRSKKIC